jgi:hypothetical protein
MSPLTVMHFRQSTILWFMGHSDSQQSQDGKINLTEDNPGQRAQPMKLKKKQKNNMIKDLLQYFL